MYTWHFSQAKNFFIVFETLVGNGEMEGREGGKGGEGGVGDEREERETGPKWWHPNGRQREFRQRKKEKEVCNRFLTILPPFYYKLFFLGGEEQKNHFAFPNFLFSLRSREHKFPMNLV